MQLFVYEYKNHHLYLKFLTILHYLLNLRTLLNLQILHYEPTQEFKEHHDYFDPATDPPENFEPGGNRLATAIIYLENSHEGGETDFMKIDTKVKPEAGSAVLFYDLKPSGEVDKLRGFVVEKDETETIVFDAPGNYVVPSE